MIGALGPPRAAGLGTKAAGTPAFLPSGYLLAALALLVLAHPTILGWVVGAGVVRGGWVSRERLAAAAGVTGAPALLVIGTTLAAGRSSRGLEVDRSRPPPPGRSGKISPSYDHLVKGCAMPPLEPIWVVFVTVVLVGWVLLAVRAFRRRRR